MLTKIWSTFQTQLMYPDTFFWNTAKALKKNLQGLNMLKTDIIVMPHVMGILLVPKKRKQRKKTKFELIKENLDFIYYQAVLLLLSFQLKTADFSEFGFFCISYQILFKAEAYYVNGIVHAGSKFGVFTCFDHVIQLNKMSPKSQSMAKAMRALSGKMVHLISILTWCVCHIKF